MRSVVFSEYSITAAPIYKQFRAVRYHCHVILPPLHCPLQYEASPTAWCPSGLCLCPTHTKTCSIIYKFIYSFNSNPSLDCQLATTQYQAGTTATLADKT